MFFFVWVRCPFVCLWCSTWCRGSVTWLASIHRTSYSRAYALIISLSKLRYFLLFLSNICGGAICVESEKETVSVVWTVGVPLQ